MNLNDLITRAMQSDDEACDLAFSLWKGEAFIKVTDDVEDINKPVLMEISGVKIHLDPYQADRLARQIDQCLMDYGERKREQEARERIEKMEGEPF